VGNNSKHGGELFVTVDYSPSATSSGGAYGTDGWGGYAAPHASLKIPSFEMMEVLYPVLYFQNEYSTDTAAPGRWRGCPAHHVQRISTTDPVVNNVQVQASRRPLLGFAGGGPAAGNYVIFDYRGDGEREIREAAMNYVQKPGEILFGQSGGGGGWGDPLERDPAAVLRDYLDEYVSLDGARHDYGVIIDPERDRVDEQATSVLRAQMQTARSSGAGREAPELGEEEAQS